MAELILQRGIVALIDDDDWDRVTRFKWYAKLIPHYATPSYHVMRCIKNPNGNWTTTSLHRFITNCPKGLQVDHLNHDTLDNRKSNLRICTHAENLRNRRPFPRHRQRRFYSNNPRRCCDYRGVTPNRNPKKPFRARIKVNKKDIHLGQFETAKEAAHAFDQKARELGWTWALNFP